MKITPDANPMDWHEKLHRWAVADDASCWCQPLVVGGIPRHRPDWGHVFWEHGEQGPMTDTQASL